MEEIRETHNLYESIRGSLKNTFLLKFFFSFIIFLCVNPDLSSTAARIAERNLSLHDVRMSSNLILVLNSMMGKE